MSELVESILEGEVPPLSAFLEALGGELPLLHRLRETPQDPGWHAEGDVHVHTEMVLEELRGLLEGPGAHLAPQRRLALVLAAALHDIAKPLTTRTRHIRGRDRIVAPRHAPRGRSYLACRLFGLGLPYETLQRVLALVGHHHDPKLLVVKERPTPKWRRLARLADPELLFLLEQADMRGRSCVDRADQIELIDLFGMECERLGLWPSPDPYAEWAAHVQDALDGHPPELAALTLGQGVRDHEEGLIHSPQEAVARAWEAREGFPQLVVLCGPSGGGKSTWARERLPGYHVVSLDETRARVAGDARDQSKNAEVQRVATERLKGHLRRREKVVWDATNLRADFRGKVAALGLRYGALVSLVVVHAPLEVYRRRNAERERAVPGAVLERQFEQWQWPTAAEAHRVAFVGADGELLAGEAPAPR